MRRFTYAWAAMALLLVGVEAAGASQNATVLWNNVVCMSLPVYVVSLLLPAEDIVTVVARRLDVSDATQNE